MEKNELAAKLLASDYCEKYAKQISASYPGVDEAQVRKAVEGWRDGKKPANIIERFVHSDLEDALENVL